MSASKVPPKAPPGGKPGDTLAAPTMWAATGFDQPASQPRQPGAGSTFDVCHVGVVLRVVLGMQVVLGLGLAHVAAGPADWLARWSQASATALPASLLWLVSTCAARSVLGRMPPAGQWLSAALLGALAGLYGEVQSSLLALWLMGAGAARSWWSVCPPMLTGAALALVTLAWLRQRGRTELPAQAQARLAELQARIRPHFLFNTLNTAIALVQIEPARAEAVLEDLAELFRQALTSPHLRASLSEEIDLAQRYLRIEQLRFGERLNLNWTLDPAAGDAEVPALMLQPLVENAVKHGVESDPDGGWLRVSTHVKAGQAVLTITNSMPQHPQATSTAGHGIALRNVRQRLRLMHDVEASFSAEVHRGETPEHASVYVVRVSVPIKQKVKS